MTISYLVEHGVDSMILVPSCQSGIGWLNTALCTLTMSECIFQQVILNRARRREKPESLVLQGFRVICTGATDGLEPTTTGITIQSAPCAATIFRGLPIERYLFDSETKIGANNTSFGNSKVEKYHCTDLNHVYTGMDSFYSILS